MTKIPYIWKSIPDDLEIFSDLEISLDPWDLLGNLLVVGDVQPNTSLLSAVYVYNTSLALVEYGYNMLFIHNTHKQRQQHISERTHVPWTC